MQHPLALLRKPVIEAPTLRGSPAEKGAIEIGHQHKIRRLGQGCRELLLQPQSRRCHTGAGNSAKGMGPGPVLVWARLAPSSRPTPLARLYAKNRRDGARLLSSALVITSIGLIRIDHPVGQVVAALGTLVCLYWWSCYRTLER
jgi:hypothetical protein